MSTPICPKCKTKFPGDPCVKCGVSLEVAKAEKAGRMSGATRKKNKHGRPGRKVRS